MSSSSPRKPSEMSLIDLMYMERTAGAPFVEFWFDGLKHAWSRPEEKSMPIDVSDTLDVLVVVKRHISRLWEFCGGLGFLSSPAESSVSVKFIWRWSLQLLSSSQTSVVLISSTGPHHYLTSYLEARHSRSAERLGGLLLPSPLNVHLHQVVDGICSTVAEGQSYCCFCERKRGTVHTVLQ